jgi:Spy/CpxP family protein refolding chaperone
MALCSLAIAAGVLGVVAVVKHLAFRRRFGGYGHWALASCGPGYARHGGSCGHERGWGHGPRAWGRGPGGSFWLRALFGRLDTTPGQEREIRSAIEELQRTAVGVKGGLHGVREEIAKAVGGESFDESAVADASVRADGAAAQLKQALSDALRRIHSVLDPRQRERLAELLAKGPSFGRGGWGGPYRDVL